MFAVLGLLCIVFKVVAVCVGDGFTFTLCLWMF